MVKKPETLNTCLPHHIAQILKWQFVLALSTLHLCTNTQRKPGMHRKKYMHTQ